MLVVRETDFSFPCDLESLAGFECFAKRWIISWFAYSGWPLECPVRETANFGLIPHRCAKPNLPVPALIVRFENHRIAVERRGPPQRSIGFFFLLSLQFSLMFSCTQACFVGHYESLKAGPTNSFREQWLVTYCRQALLRVQNFSKSYVGLITDSLSEMSVSNTNLKHKPLTKSMNGKT